MRGEATEAFGFFTRETGSLAVRMRLVSRHLPLSWLSLGGTGMPGESEDRREFNDTKFGKIGFVQPV